MDDGSKVRATPYVQLVSNVQSAFSDAFNLLGAEVRNNRFPLPDSGGTQTERPRDIRGSLKVINNVLFEHKNPFTTVKDCAQPEYQSPGLTSVDMDRFATIDERLTAAMTDRNVSASELARACGVSPAAVHKWQNGGKMSADNSAAAARALGVREEWLRTGRLPRERENGTQEQGVDQVIDILQGLRGPLAALAEAIDKLSAPAKSEPNKKRTRG